MYGRGATVFLMICLGGSGVAVAADLGGSSPFQPEPFASSSPWSGLYFGGAIGGNVSPSLGGSANWFNPYVSPFSNSVFSSDLPSSYAMTSRGWSAGGIAGYDKQMGPLVVGVVADFEMLQGASSGWSASGVTNWTNFAQTWSNVPYTASYNQQLTTLGTIRGRVGAAVGNFMVYGTGGLAYGWATSKTSMTASNGYTWSGSGSGLAIGYVVGAGAEYAVDSHWRVGLEGTYYNLGARDTVGVANFTLVDTQNNVLPSPQYDVKGSLSGFQLRLNAVYELGDEAASPQLTMEADRNSDVPVTVGVRVGESVGRNQMTLYDATGKTQLSRLTYTGAAAYTMEPMFRVDLPAWNVYMTGYLGLGAQKGGNLQDEDFPPVTSPYSSTNSALADGTLQYGALDVGFYAYNTDWLHLGGVVGWMFETDNYNAFGCTQTATNTSVCKAGEVQSNTLTLSDAYNWSAPRLGLAGAITVPMGLTISGTAAWLPMISATDTDTHWLRMPGDFTSPIPGNGAGSTGYQLEAEARYRLGRSFDLGAGMRYDSLSSKGTFNFQVANAAAGPQVATYASQRIQGYLQAGFHF